MISFWRDVPCAGAPVASPAAVLAACCGAIAALRGASHASHAVSMACTHAAVSGSSCGSIAASLAAGRSAYAPRNAASVSSIVGMCGVSIDGRDALLPRVVIP